MPTSERRLAAIMFTDIVGYTALMARDEDAGRHARDRHEAVVRPLVEKYHGEWVERTGDETLSSFPSAPDAVNCALSIQTALQDESELRVRVGIHLGEIVSREGSVHGDGGNIASRIRPLAEPGGICISDEVQYAIRNQENIETAQLGEHELKNVGRPVSVFVVSGTGGKPPGRTSERPAERRDTIQSLAVLPPEVLEKGRAIGRLASSEGRVPARPSALWTGTCQGVHSIGQGDRMWLPRTPPRSLRSGPAF